MESEPLKYPIGKFQKPKQITIGIIDGWINDIEHLPHQISKTVNNLTQIQLDTRYRPDGWTIRQVVHHLPDSHMNNYIRFRLSLTEDNPTVKPYLESSWAELQDAKFGNIDISIILLEAIHIRWVMLLRSLDNDQLSRSFVNPESGNKIKLDENIGFYAWHGKHHLTHIKNCIVNMKSEN